jgi:hypothetical protein
MQQTFTNCYSTAREEIQGTAGSLGHTIILSESCKKYADTPFTRLDTSILGLKIYRGKRKFAVRLFSGYGAK